MANVFTADPNCVALWRFENGALTADSIGTNTLTDNNTVGTSTGDYKEGAACADLEESSDEYFSITDANLDSGFPLKSGATTPKFSVCGWFKPESISNDAIVAKGDHVLGTNSLWVALGATGNSFTFRIGYGPSQVEVLYNGGTLSTGRWYHFACTFDDSDKSWKAVVWDETAGSKIIDESGTATNNISLTAEALTIGKNIYNGSPNYGFDGLLDEIAFCDDILTADEIDAIRGGTYTTNVNVSATTATLTVTTNAASIAADTNANASTATLTIAAYNAGVNLNVFVNATSIPIAISSQSSTIYYDIDASASTSLKTISAKSSNINYAIDVTASIETLSIVTKTPSITYVGPFVNGRQLYLVEYIKRIIQDTTYSYDDILTLLNEAQRLVAGGVLLVYPDRTQVFTSPLEGLRTSGTVTAGTTNPYVNLPSDYGRELYYIYNTTVGQIVIMTDSLATLLDNSPSLDDEGNVTDAVIEGDKLYFQRIPDEEQTLTLYYFREPHDMVSYTSTGISFSGTTISDSNNGFGYFYAGQTIDVHGPCLNYGTYTVVSVASDGSTITVPDTLSNEDTGFSTTIRSRPDGIPDHLLEDVLVNRALVKYLSRDRNKSALVPEYNEKFYRAMIDLETDQENVRRPKQWRAA